VIASYAVLASRIRQDLPELERVVVRVERATQARRERSADQDLLLDSVALNLHDFYTGLERIFMHIASVVDRTLPTGTDWHRELLQQMAVEAPALRPAVLSEESSNAVDEFLRFRHVVRHIYAFSLDPERVERLAGRLRSTFDDVRAALTAFAAHLDRLAQEA
jgi:hypothetical protein